MNISSKNTRRILWCETAGFALIIAVSWLNELIRLTCRLLGGTAESNWRESLLETGVTMLVWLVIFLMTRRVLSRLRGLEGFWEMYAMHKRLAQQTNGSERNSSRIASRGTAS